MPKEAVAKQHKIIVCKVGMRQLKKTKPVGVTKMCWWHLNKEVHRDKFVQGVEAKLGGEVEKTWSALTTVLGKQEKKY